MKPGFENGRYELKDMRNNRERFNNMMKSVQFGGKSVYHHGFLVGMGFKIALSNPRNNRNGSNVVECKLDQNHIVEYVFLVTYIISTIIFQGAGIIILLKLIDNLYQKDLLNIMVKQVDQGVIDIDILLIDHIKDAIHQDMNKEE